MELHKTIRELVRILLRDEYLDFLLTYKKVPIWCVDLEGKEYNIVKSVGVDEDGLDMASELSLCISLAIIDKDIDLDKTVWLLDLYNECLSVYEDLRYNTFIVNYMNISSHELGDIYADRDVIEEALFSLFTYSSYPVSIVPVK